MFVAILVTKVKPEIIQCPSSGELMNKRWHISQWNTVRSQTIEFQVIENCKDSGGWELGGILSSRS